MKDIEIITLENYGDARGAIYNILDVDLQFLDKIQNIHFGEIRPNSIRGNHYHHQGKELLVITYSDTWTLAWAKKDSDKISKKEFKGSGAVLLKFNKGVVHSVKNNGRKSLEIIALSNRESTDTTSRVLLT
jgi:dTDP-4-dehydrorhamnose 3,5-epimerase-like enzyme